MSHKPPLPEAATSPYPSHPAPIEHDADAVAPAAAKDTSGEEPTGRLSALNLGIAAAGAAIGSAAIAAALVFYNRPGIPAKRAAAKTPAAAKRTTKPKAPAARKPRSTAPKPATKAAAATKPPVKAAAKPTAAPKAAVKPRARKSKTTTTD